jgi:LPXTG-motif cell wall-anchored protein
LSIPVTGSSIASGEAATTDSGVSRSAIEQTEPGITDSSNQDINEGSETDPADKPSKNPDATEPKKLGKDLSGGSERARSPVTGDSNEIYIYSAILVAALITLILLVRKKKKDK